MSLGRVGYNQSHRKLKANLQVQQQAQEKLYEQVSTNKNILKPSDDPIATSKAMNIRDELHRLEEYDNLISSSEVWTNITNVALDNTSSTWKRVNEISISAADGTKTSADRAGMVEELEQLLGHLTQVANTSHSGRYIFGGSETETPPFRSETDPNTGRITGVFYEGNSDIRKVKTKDHGTTEISVLGSNAGNPDQSGVFIDSNTDVNMFNTIIELRDKLLANDIVGISGDNGILKEVETAAESVTSAQVRLGGTQEVLELDRNRVIEQSANMEQYLSEIEDADIAQLILELNNVQNVYEAALAAGARMFQTSLLNYI
jgi:flagellar hook-associated protein 3 FlgL